AASINIHIASGSVPKSYRRRVRDTFNNTPRFYPPVPVQP
ncbi:unnamed protein product, partial [marine sediment metagenome]